MTKWVNEHKIPGTVPGAQLVLNKCIFLSILYLSNELKKGEGVLEINDKDLF